MAPNGSESRRSTSPSAESASSTEPPPMSHVTIRPCPTSKCACALRNESRASSSPEMTRTVRPASFFTCRTNAPPSAASRTALVATHSMRSAPSWRASVTMRCNASIAASALSTDRCPVSSTPVLRRGAAFISSTVRIWPVGLTSATIARMEFEPMSIAAMRRDRAPAPSA